MALIDFSQTPTLILIISVTSSLQSPPKNNNKKHDICFCSTDKG